jgi:hypothetical protein
MIDEFIDYLKRIKEQLAGESCLKGEPFMKLGTWDTFVMKND